MCLTFLRLASRSLPAFALDYLFKDVSTGNRPGRNRESRSQGR